jgi:hypothetical protein
MKRLRDKLELHTKACQYSHIELNFIQFVFYENVTEPLRDLIGLCGVSIKFSANLILYPKLLVNLKRF